MTSPHTYRPYQPPRQAKTLARALGWFSLGIGAAAFLSPRKVARATGLPKSDNLLRAIGVREIAFGIGLLRKETPSGWAWSRVGGDVMDLAVLGFSFFHPYADRRKLGAAAAAVTGVALFDLLCSQELGGTMKVKDDSSVEYRRSVTVNRPASDLYALWRDEENLPGFLPHVKSVRRLGDRRSRWVLESSSGRDIRWEAILVEEVPNERLIWCSPDRSGTKMIFAVEFTELAAGRGTEVAVTVRHQPRGGLLAASLSRVFGTDPKPAVIEDLRTFKQLMEAGELPTTDGQPAGRARGETFLDRLVP